MPEVQDEADVDPTKRLLGVALLAALILVLAFLLIHNAEKEFPGNLPVEQDTEAPPLLASELIFDEDSDGFVRSIEIDPKLANRPSLVRQLKKWRIKNMHTKDWACSSADGTGCYEDVVIEREFENDRLLSILETTDTFTGGAHGIAIIQDHLIDLKTGKTLRLGDLFQSWAVVQPIFQRHLCTDLHYQDPAFECPPVQQQAITLWGHPGQQASMFIIYTQDYALGSYAAGRTSVTMDLSNVLYDHMKPEYQSAFEKPPSFM